MKTKSELTIMQVSLDAEAKALLWQEYGIDIDSDLFYPRLDFVSKCMFTAETEEARRSLISFLNATLKFKNKKRVVKVLNPVATVESPKHKKAVFEVHYDKQALK